MPPLRLYCITRADYLRMLGLVVSKSDAEAISKFCNIAGFQTMWDYTNALSHGMRKIMVEQQLSSTDYIKYSLRATAIPNFTKLETLSKHYNKDYIIFPSLEELRQCVGFKSIAKYKLKKYCF